MDIFMLYLMQRNKTAGMEECGKKCRIGKRGKEEERNARIEKRRKKAERNARIGR